MFKKYHLLLVQRDNTSMNVIIKGSVSDYIISNNDMRYVLINQWRITKTEYLNYRKALKDLPSE